MNVDTGEIRRFASHDMLQEAILTGNWIPLGKAPKPSCKKCYGRGHVGRNVDTGKYVPCSCVKPLKVLAHEQNTGSE